jgi:hypothetical protein
MLTGLISKSLDPDNLANESHPAGQERGSGSRGLLVEIANISTLLNLFLGSCILLRESLVACSFFFGCVRGWLLTPPNPLLSSFGSHRNNRMLSMQAAGVLLMSLLCACGPAVVRGQLTFAQACRTSGSQADCSFRSPPLTAVPTGIPTSTTTL